MLFQYILLFFVTALVLTILSFHRSIDRLGQVLFMLFGGVFWMAVAMSLLKIHFRWGGSTSVVSYTYIPSGESAALVYAFGIMGMIFMGLALLRAVELTYSPVVDGMAELSGEKKEYIHDLWGGGR